MSSDLKGTVSFTYGEDLAVIKKPAVGSVETEARQDVGRACRTNKNENYDKEESKNEVYTAGS